MSGGNGSADSDTPLVAPTLPKVEDAMYAVDCEVSPI